MSDKDLNKWIVRLIIMLCIFMAWLLVLATVGVFCV